MVRTDFSIVKLVCYTVCAWYFMTGTSHRRRLLNNPSILHIIVNFSGVSWWCDSVMSRIICSNQARVRKIKKLIVILPRVILHICVTFVVHVIQRSISPFSKMSSLSICLLDCYVIDCHYYCLSQLANNRQYWHANESCLK